MSSKSDQIAEDSLRVAMKSISAKLNGQLTLGSKPHDIDYADQASLQCCTLEEADAIEILNYIKPKDLAEQLTMNEWAVWSKIQPSELLELCWTKQNRQETSPNVLKLISVFNATSKWITMSILTAEDLDQQVLRYENWILTAKHLMDLNNFNTAMSILSGLRSASIYRLTKTAQV
eukprot:TRINITY_DN9557_c0_g1_i1.p1 TRINITY_DN9557_c0_g1~~TRINITY_DN9557_c0_g1_i1.p1  ORF type:complete len:176 (-),score=17.08 TRINITY_DN9557_c0_g1_i1:403-930(-)